MTLDQMCISASRYSDRYDEFEKNDEGEYEDDALNYFNVFKDAINEAYMAISRNYAKPDNRELVPVDENCQIDLEDLEYPVFFVKGVFDETGTISYEYNFDTKYIMNVEGVKPGSIVSVFYHYMPDRLEKLKDEPVFTEAVADPMIYISLAVARIWMSEKKFEYAQQWMQQYYMLLKDVNASLKSRIDRRIPRRRFR